MAIATVVAFLPCLDAGFLEWDDDRLITGNPHFRGLDAASVKWMFTTALMGAYQPLAWLTYAVDHAVWGLDPRGYHLTNLLLHVASAMVLFSCATRLLRRALPDVSPGRLTAAAALAAGLWAVHPLRVESVAWIAERRDVLAGLLLFLSLRSWLVHRGEGRGDGDEPPAARAYWTSLALFAASVFTKPTALLWPVVLLVLDRRLLAPGTGRGTGRRLLRDKIPFLAVSGAAAVVAYLGQRVAGAVVGADQVGGIGRVVTAGYSAAFYVVKTVLPTGLRAHYARPLHFDPWSPELLAGVAVALGLSALAVALRRRRPALFTVWACYLLLLAPVSGIVPFSSHLVADRFSYLPGAALAILLAGWWAGKVGSRSGVAVAVVVLCALGGSTFHLSGTWKDTGTLFRRVLDHEPDNWVALEKLGNRAERRGDLDRAANLLLRAVELRGDPPNTLARLAWVEARRGNVPRADELLDRALRANPRLVDGWFVRGHLRALSGDYSRAESAFRRTADLDSSHAMSRSNLAELVAPRDPVAAEGLYRRALEIDPSSSHAREGLARLLVRLGRSVEARRLRPPGPARAE